MLAECLFSSLETSIEKFWGLELD